MKLSIFKIHIFDEITKFRLLNLFFFAIGFMLITPIIVDLKGEYLATWLISMFLIGEQLMSRTNRYFVETFSLSTLFKLGIIVHILFLSVSFLYFYDKYIMILLDSTIALIDIAIFNSYSIKLTNYLTEYHPDSMSDFQILRSEIWADGVLIGLSVTTLSTLFFSNGFGIVLFIIYNICFNIFLFKHRNFFKERGL